MYEKVTCGYLDKVVFDTSYATQIHLKEEGSRKSTQNLIQRLWKFHTNGWRVRPSRYFFSNIMSFLENFTLLGSSILSIMDGFILKDRMIFLENDDKKSVSSLTLEQLQYLTCKSNKKVDERCWHDGKQFSYVMASAVKPTIKLTHAFL